MSTRRRSSRIGDAFAEERVHRLVDNTIGLAREHGPGVYTGAVVNALGDFVSGGLHPAFAKTDEVEAIGATLRARDLLGWGLRRMADEFGHVYKNFDWLIYQLLVREFADDPRIRIDVRPSNEVFYRVFSRRFLAMHGDMLGVKGGDGIIGSIGPIMRGKIKTRGSAASSGIEYDTLLMGHWHQELWLPQAIVANTLKGYDEYAKNALRAPISAPSQPLWFVHPRIGISSRWNVLVEDQRRTDSAAWISVFDPAQEAA